MLFLQDRQWQGNNDRQVNTIPSEMRDLYCSPTELRDTFAGNLYLINQVDLPVRKG